ncbi:hypothetical protein KY326_02690, partial [Candidatus Woesearchaeota archaeon]|nr:hypothetical protein [Candidatus Woesearchaeota archaeon]
MNLGDVSRITDYGEPLVYSGKHIPEGSIQLKAKKGYWLAVVATVPGHEFLTEDHHVEEMPQPSEVPDICDRLADALWSKMNILGIDPESAVITAETRLYVKPEDAEFAELFVDRYTPVFRAR